MTNRNDHSDQKRREQFMVDDDREKPDRLPEDPDEYLEDEEADDEDEDDAEFDRVSNMLDDPDDAILPPGFLEELEDTAVLPAEDEPVENVSDAILPEEDDQIFVEEALTKSHRRFITLDEHSEELFFGTMR